MVLPRNCPLFRHIASLTLILAGAGCRDAFAPDHEVRASAHGSASVAAARPDGATPRSATDFQPNRVEAALGINDGDPIFIDPLPIGEPNPITAQPLQAPVMAGLHSEIQGADLVFTARFNPASRHFIYDPVHPGGWMLQLFLNTDQDPSGYWKGYDYVVRGGEKNPDGTYVVRQTMGGGGEGGWGAVSGAATLLADDALELRVPLAALGNDDGYVDFALELYATVSCPECPDGYTQVVVKDLFGTTGSPALAATTDPERSVRRR